MPEGTADATILIATSFQALNRVIKDNQETMACDSTIVILFAAFFIEANLNYIIGQLNQQGEMLDFLYGKKRRGEKHPGLYDKLGWFYNQYLEESKAANKKQMRESGITRKLTERFPGLDKIYRFRNDVCHGIINTGLANRKDAEELRQRAKDTVNQLFDITFDKTGLNLPRDMNYKKAISLA